MVGLEKVFNRFPKLSENQKAELARRRVVRFFNIVYAVSPNADHQLDIYYALGYLGTRDLFRSYK